MLRISVTETNGEQITLRLDGRLTGRWVELLERTCEAQLEKNVPVAIDLRNVSFADRDGVALLGSLTKRRAKILNALSFIDEQIRKVEP